MNKPGTYNTLDILERMQLFAVKHGYGIIKPQLDIFHKFKFLVGYDSTCVYCSKLTSFHYFIEMGNCLEGKDKCYI